MRNADVRRACLELITNRVCAETPAVDPSPVALGWQLEKGDASPRAMAALCAGALAGSGTRWQPSPALRALLREYGAVRVEGHADERGGRTQAPSARGRTADALH